MMRVGWMQILPVPGDPRANLEHVAAVLEQARADLWVLPELFSTGYLLLDRREARSLAEPVVGGPTVAGLVRLARQHRCAFVAGLAERGEGDRAYNSAVALDGDGLRGVYRKLHLFDREKSLFDPGDLPLAVVPLAGARVGMMICFDWRFPEVARTLALQGAQILAHPSNLVLPHGPAAMVTRALENGVFTVTADRCGVEERNGLRLAFIGQSSIVGPDGARLSLGPAEGEAWDVVELDPARADDKRVTAGNDLFGDRRPGFYRCS